MNWKSQVELAGYGIMDQMVAPTKVGMVLCALEELKIPRSRAGVRHVLRQPAVSKLANGEMLEIAAAILGSSATPFRATLFDKSPNSNWLVAWHQDTALPLQEKREVEGWGPWSIKDGVFYAHAPASALERVIALRLSLDESTSENGPLRVLPGTHAAGVLTDDQIHIFSQQIVPAECCARAGGIVLMKPLVIHASSKSISSAPRRVLHVEYAASTALEDGNRLAIC